MALHLVRISLFARSVLSSRRKREKENAHLRDPFRADISQRPRLNVVPALSAEFGFVLSTALSPPSTLHPPKTARRKARFRPLSGPHAPRSISLTHPRRCFPSSKTSTPSIHPPITIPIIHCRSGKVFASGSPFWRLISTLGRIGSGRFWGGGGGGFPSRCEGIGFRRPGFRAKQWEHILIGEIKKEARSEFRHKFPERRRGLIIDCIRL